MSGDRDRMDRAQVSGDGGRRESRRKMGAGISLLLTADERG